MVEPSMTERALLAWTGAVLAVCGAVLVAAGVDAGTALLVAAVACVGAAWR